MGLHRGIDGAEPLRPDRIGHLDGTIEVRRATGTRVLATGTMACPNCDAPVLPPPGGASPATPVSCPYCHHGAPLRAFLSLAVPSRPARVIVRVSRVAEPAVRRA